MGTSDQEKKERSVMWQALGLAWDLGYIIAVPLVVLALSGRLLDKRFGTSPLFLLAGVFISLIITTVGIYKKTQAITKGMDEK